MGIDGFPQGCFPCTFCFPQECSMHPELDHETCSGCGVCLEICPNEVYQVVGERPKPVALEECIECGACEEQCPVHAIVLFDD